MKKLMSRFDNLMAYVTRDPDSTLGSRQRNTLILEEFGIPVESDEMEMEISSSDMRWAQDWLERMGHVSGESLIAEIPKATRPGGSRVYAREPLA